MTGTPEWMADAACRGIDPAVMVPTPANWRNPNDDPRYVAAVAAAKAICDECPVVGPCLSWAIRRREVGVWGGTTEQERRRIRRREQRAREWDASVAALFDRIRCEMGEAFA